MKYEQWTDVPVPIWAAEVTPDDRPDEVDDLTMSLMMANRGVTYRGVNLDRLPVILEHGVDVEPTDAIIYCGPLEKAYEYGRLPKVVMVYRTADERGDVIVQPAVTTIHDITSPADAASRRRSHPHEMQRAEGSPIVLCRVAPESEAHYAYYRAYGRFIPGDPWDALIAILVFGDAEALSAARAVIETRRHQSTVQ
ncbi:hypothetical protein J2X46_001235 [Nocardioides sp. BE266]|uniref:hypothetical protein n=1 Tax=Nocardioides sp. BE266 TaxID=2817725 RepID=UPI00285D65C3|nr:hypothetical protein [Nocardioides sp. BE266]MDR7252259.1 hypothetical protein [Nocardioides sp. BE266]